MHLQMMTLNDEDSKRSQTSDSEASSSGSSILEPGEPK